MIYLILFEITLLTLLFGGVAYFKNRNPITWTLLGSASWLIPDFIKYFLVHLFSSDARPIIGICCLILSILLSLALFLFLAMSRPKAAK